MVVVVLACELLTIMSVSRGENHGQSTSTRASQPDSFTFEGESLFNNIVKKFEKGAFNKKFFNPDSLIRE